MKKKYSLTKTIRFWGITFLIIIGVTVSGIDLIFNRIVFNMQSNEIRTSHNNRQKQLIKNEVNRTVSFIKHRKKDNEKRNETKVKIRTYEAHSIAWNIYRKNKSKKDPIEIKKMIVDALTSTKFKQEEGNCFIAQLTEKDSLSLNFLFPKAINHNFSQDFPKEKYTKQDIAELKRNGERLIISETDNSDSNQKKQTKNISFIKLFKPYNWLIATTLDVTDMEKQFKKELLKELAPLRFGERDDGSFFIINYDGIPLMDDRHQELVGKEISDLADLNGIKIIEEIRKIADKPDGDFTSYLWEKPSTKSLSPKISFVKGIDDWGWLIGAGLFQDDIESDISRMSLNLNNKLKSKLLYIVFITLTLLILINYFFNKLVSRMRCDLDLLFSFFNNAMTFNNKIDRKKINIKEFDHLAENANKMLEEKNQAKQNLLREKEQLFVTIRSIGDAVITTDTDSNVVLMNSVAEHLTGWDNKKAKGEPLAKVFNIINVTSRKRVENPVAQVLETGKIVGLANHTVLISKDGTEYQVADSASPIKDTNGTISGVVLVFRDVTQEYKMQNDLQKSEENMKALFNAMQDVVLEIDNTGKYIFVAPTSPELFYKPTDLLLGKTFHEIFTAKQADAFLNLVQKSLKENNTQSMEYPLVINNKKIWFECRVSPKTKDTVLYIARDITDQKQIENELYLQNRKFSTLLQNLNGMVYSCKNDYNWTETFVSNGALELTGYQAEDFVEKNKISVSEIILPEYQKDLREKWKKCLDNREPMEAEYEIKTASGKIKWVWERGRGIFDEDGKVLHLEGFITDIDKRKKIEEEKKILNDQLLHRSKMDAIGQLAGGVAHDFNNMLSGIMGAAQLLQYNNVDLNEKNKSYIEMILQASTKAADLTGKLLAFGRKGKINSTAIDIHDVIHNTTMILNRTIDKQIKLIVDKKAQNHTAIGDDSGLQNAFMNLIINASHAMPDGGEINIKTTNINLDENYCNASPFSIEPGEYIEIEIRDTGSGIAPENLKKIFEPFFTTKEQGKGTGLGLAAVYGTIQDHHGAITVYSEIGSGTSFHLYLPCSGTEVTHQTTDEKILTGEGKILLVDDEELIRITGKIMLEEMGYEVLIAQNGSEAVDKFKEYYNSIDLVIMDMIMPKMNGREAFHLMKEIQKDCKIIISSGFTKNEKLDELKKSGLSGFISKPFRDFELSQLITKVIGH